MAGIFYYKGEFFIEEADFWRFTEKWPKNIVDQKSLDQMLLMFKKNILLNQRDDITIKNGDMEKLLCKTFIEAMRLM